MTARDVLTAAATRDRRALYAALQTALLCLVDLAGATRTLDRLPDLDLRVMEALHVGEVYGSPAHLAALDRGTWPCMVCGTDRPDAAISVAHRSSKLYDGWPFEPRPHINVRYCNDRAACVAFATADGHWEGPPPRTSNGPPTGGPVGAALAAAATHVFVDTTTCVCGYGPQTGLDWDRHRMEAALLAVADWMATRTSSTLNGDPHVLAADWAAGILRENIAAAR